jgi:Flp pilus assembly protein TadG
MSLKSFTGQRGQAVVETTVGFLLFFVIFMSIVEFAHLLYAKVTSQYALGTAGRYMVTGRTGLDANGVKIPRDIMIHDVFCANIIAAGVQCPSLGGTDFTFVCLPAPTVCSPAGGGPEQTVLVTVKVVKPALMPFFSRFFPAGGVRMTLSTTWKNEPFS